MISKSDLAQLYFPQSDPHGAVRNFMQMVSLCRPLTDELARTGYKKTQRCFTPRQTALIYAHLGEP